METALLGGLSCPYGRDQLGGRPSWQLERFNPLVLQQVCLPSLCARAFVIQPQDLAVFTLLHSAGQRKPQGHTDLKAGETHSAYEGRISQS